jgi:hypothetical protein
MTDLARKNLLSQIRHFKERVQRLRQQHAPEIIIVAEEERLRHAQLRLNGWVGPIPISERAHRAVVEYERAHPPVHGPKNPNDGFGPPKVPIEVCCLHCSRTYSSAGMVFEDRFGLGEALWYCQHTDCDGIGFKFDIVPADDPICLSASCGNTTTLLVGTPRP